MIKAYIAVTEKQRESLMTLYKSIHMTATFFTSKPVLVVDHFLKTVEFKSYSEMCRLDVEQMSEEELESVLFAHYTGELERDYQLRPF